jgi:heme iron utilization protein
VTKELPEKTEIKDLISMQKVFVLCTQDDGSPYGSLIAYAFTEDLKKFYFSTSRNSRKFQYLIKNPRAAFVIDNRCDAGADLLKTKLLTVTAASKEVDVQEEEYITAEKMLRKRHPALSVFLDEPSTAIIRLDTLRFFYVTQFQDVFEFIP